ncbi:hypothetical protein BDY19DRAFT_688943 [Irpex rosettiformis]|uniref:Uncharacterized protein n=1 Tax=Irpex rosettiformis TaxID=378272 RepID=A0ACB8UAJ9_9APHY|nr:hypothetical protein BDY19DRAFT_688943 [Irpex rosettiformis]
MFDIHLSIHTPADSPLYILQLHATLFNFIVNVLEVIAHARISRNILYSNLSRLPFSVTVFFAVFRFFFFPSMFIHRLK